jgi:hypothetical protein
MPPIPKDRSTRQRRNVVAGARKLSAATEVEAPMLPDGNDWHSMTESWWADVWASPMAPEYDPSDVHGLFLLAVLVDGFWKSPTKELAAEIRLQRQCFGLTPIDRRRLQWEVDRGEEAEAKTRRRRTPKPVETPEEDPRRLLA